MLEVYDDSRLGAAGPDDLSDALERGAIVFFPRAPVPLPSDDDLDFFREQLPQLLKLKNISYHPEAGHVNDTWLFVALSAALMVSEPLERAFCG